MFDTENVGFWGAAPLPPCVCWLVDLVLGFPQKRQPELGERRRAVGCSPTTIHKKAGAALTRRGVRRAGNDGPVRRWNALPLSCDLADLTVTVSVHAWRWEMRCAP